MVPRREIVIGLIGLVAAFGAACSDSQPTPEATAPLAPTASPTGTPAPTSTAVPTPAPSPTVTATKVPTPTPAPTVTPAVLQLPEIGVNLLAYVDADSGVGVIRPDGSASIGITPDQGFFTWPMWSPDATEIIFSGLPIQDNVRGQFILYSYTLQDGQTRVIYENESGMGPIGPGMPHYTLMAPDSSLLSFMASLPEGLTLFLDDPGAEGGAAVVLQNAPLYVAWSSDSRHMLVHSAGEHYMVDVEGEVTVEDLGIQAPDYRAPAWWPTGNKIVFVSEAGADQPGIYIADIDLGSRMLLEEVSSGVAFLWDPNGESLAVTRRDPNGGLMYKGIALYSPDGARQPVEIQDDVFAFFWSPDGTELAYVTPTETSGILQWFILRVADGSRRPLVEFRPTSEQFTIFQFFDQLAYSHSLWSADSSSLVFAGAVVGDAVSASANRQQGPHIIVVDVETASAEAIAEGFLAVWSPR